MSCISTYDLIIVFFLKLEQSIKAFYQSAIIGECVDVQFKNKTTPISLSSSDKTINGWNLITFQLREV